MVITAGYTCILNEDVFKWGNRITSGNVIKMNYILTSIHRKFSMLFKCSLESTLHNVISEVWLETLDICHSNKWIHIKLVLYHLNNFILS